MQVQHSIAGPMRRGGEPGLNVSQAHVLRLSELATLLAMRRYLPTPEDIRG